ncbi:MAG: M23 family metallopeptidase [Ghiorsea sp.]
MKKITFIFVLLILPLSSVLAQTYKAEQGNVLRIKAPAEALSNVQVTAFGKNWPVFQHKGENIAWIAIHLKTKPANYRITWQSNKKTWLENIAVKKGDFRISHIKVAKKMASFDKKALKRIRADQKAIKNAYKTSVEITNSWPEMIQPVTGIISTPFAAQRYVNGNPRSPHSGIDIAAPSGTPVHSPLAGKVILVSDMYLNGNLIAIGHGNGITTVYAHLKRALVKEGDLVKQGDVFAEVGSTGRSTGPHLHWGVHFSGAKVNPKTMLPNGL